MAADLQFETDNTYTLLARFLAPQKSPETLESFKAAIINNRIEWETLVLQANIQMCVPLWYARLKQDDLLQYLPQDLCEYLQALYDANRERNEELKAGLHKLLVEFNKESIDSILLKGAATFIDDLYNAPGARYMGDMDILLHAEDLDKGRRILEDQGYEVVPNPDMELSGLPTDIRHHQIQRYTKPNTPIAVELHFRLSYGQAGRIVGTEEAWENAIPVSFMERSTKILSPTHRLLLNIAHALLPHREFIQGDISLLQLAEFSSLSQRYKQSIDWSKSKQLCKDLGITTESDVLVNLTNKLMPKCVDTSWVIQDAKWHLDRVFKIGDNYVRSQLNKIPITAQVTLLIYRVYYLFMLPAWFFNNVAFTENDTLHRIRLIIIKLIKIKSWRKI